MIVLCCIVTIAENERRLDDQLQEISNVKVELNDKRQRVNELEVS